MRLRPAFVPALLLFATLPAVSLRAQDDSYRSAYRSMSYVRGARQAEYPAHFETSSPHRVCPCENDAYHAHAAAVAHSTRLRHVAYEQDVADGASTAGEQYLPEGEHYFPGEAAWVGYESTVPTYYGRKYAKRHAHKCRDKAPGPLWCFCHDMRVLWDSVLDDVDNLACSTIYGFRDPCYFGRPWPSYVYGGMPPDDTDRYVPPREVPWEADGELLEPPPEPPPVDPSVAPYSSSAMYGGATMRRYTKRVDPLAQSGSVLAPRPSASDSAETSQGVRITLRDSGTLHEATYAAAQPTSRQLSYQGEANTWLARPAAEQRETANLYYSERAASPEGVYPAQLADAIDDGVETGPELAPPDSPSRAGTPSLRVVGVRGSEPTLAPVRRGDAAGGNASGNSHSTLRLLSAPPNPLR